MPRLRHPWISCMLGIAMDLLKELERRREKVREQLRAKQAEIEAINRIIDGMQRDGTANISNGRARRTTGTRGGGRFAKLGLSDAIRAVAIEWKAPSDIRDAMVAGGYKHTAKSPLLGGVFSTCKRMAEDGEFEVRENTGRKEYRVKPESGS